MCLSVLLWRYRTFGLWRISESSGLKLKLKISSSSERSYFLIFWDFLKNRKSQLLAEVIETVVGQGLCKYHYSILPIATRRKVYTCYSIFNDIGWYILDVSHIPTKGGGGGGGYASCFAVPMVTNIPKPQLDVGWCRGGSYELPVVRTQNDRDARGSVAAKLANREDRNSKPCLALIYSIQ